MPSSTEPKVIPEFEPFVRALGVLALQWNHLEHTLNEFIWLLSNSDRQAGACITSQMIGSGPRIRAIASLMKLRSVPASIIKDFNSLSSEIESTGRQRNRLVHDQMIHHVATKVMVRIEITADRVPKYAPVVIETGDINKVTISCEKLEKDVREIIKRTINESPAWPRKQFEQSQDIFLLDPVSKDNSASTPIRPLQS